MPDCCRHTLEKKEHRECLCVCVGIENMKRLLQSAWEARKKNKKCRKTKQICRTMDCLGRLNKLVTDIEKCVEAVIKSLIDL